MARPTKTGLDYFPLDVDFHDDDKVGLLISEFGVRGESILTRLLCKIYKNGYYYSWGDDECLLFCRWAGGIFVPNQVSEVVAGCIRRSIFDKRVFDAFGVLTSRGIQKRFLQAVKERKNVEIIADFWLLDVPKTGQFRVNRSNNSINLPNNRVNRSKSTQSKVKESKEEKSKEDPPIIPPSGDDGELSFENIWILYGRKGNKKTSLARWNKLTLEAKELARANIPDYVDSTPDEQYRKNFEVYINREGWNDRIIKKTQSNGRKTTGEWNKSSFD